MRIPFSYCIIYSAFLFQTHLQDTLNPASAARQAGLSAVSTASYFPEKTADSFAHDYQVLKYPAPEK